MMTTHEQKGVVVALEETKVFDSGFQKREVIVDLSDNPQYPSPVPFTFKKDRVNLLTPVKVGDQVTVKFSVDGRKWDGPNGTRYFTDLTGWGITVNVQSATPESPTAVTTAKSADVIKVWAIKHGCTLEEAATDWNTASSELTKTWKTIFPAKRRNQLMAEDLAAIVNAITGAQSEAESEPTGQEFIDMQF